MKIYIPIKKFQWTIHNIIGHPFSELFYLFGLPKIAKKIHDITLPED